MEYCQVKSVALDSRDKFFDRPALTVSYRSDLDKVQALVPEPLVVEDPIVSLAFLFMIAPGLGDYYEVSHAVPPILSVNPMIEQTDPHLL